VKHHDLYTAEVGDMPLVFLPNALLDGSAAA
jgi:hypothetical protein